MTRKRVTIRDLAKELGMSDRAVSQALNPRESNVKLRPETVERVRKLAEERNYRPDTSAQAMRSGRFFNLGYFEAKAHSTALSLLGSDAGVYDGASRLGYRVVLIKLPADTSKSHNPIPSVFREAHLDALVVSNVGSLTPECKEAIDSSGVPVVYLNEKKETNAVYVDDIGGARNMTRHLIERGYKRIVYLPHLACKLPGGGTEHYSIADRLKGYLLAMREHDLPPEVIQFGDDWVKELNTWFDEKSCPEAILCPGDFVVLRLLRVLYQRQVRIPEQLALTNYSDDLLLEIPVPITTLRMPFYEMGVAAAEMAIQLFNDRSLPSLPSRVFQTELLIRDSTPPKV